jgi:hypothetical protein
VTVPEFRLIGRADPMLTQTAHGPPRSAWLTRGPPFALLISGSISVR